MIKPIVHVYINRVLVFIDVSIALINVYTQHLGLALFCFALAYISFATMKHWEGKVEEWNQKQ